MKRIAKWSSAIAWLGAGLLTGCSEHFLGTPPHGEVGVAVAPTSIPGNSVAKAGPTTPVSGGPNLLGVVVPTGDAVVNRIQNGLEGVVRPSAGNFSRSLAQVRTNLPKDTNVQNAAGYDQVALLAYAACSDMTTGSNPQMQTRYNVRPGSSIATNQAALVAAGIRILDQHTANLASQGPEAAQISSIFTTLVQDEASVATNTSTIAFITVCTAASTAGASMLGL